MNHFCCFSQSSIASLTALPNAPFLPPYFKATLARNCRSRPFGRITMVLPIISLILLYFAMFIYLCNLCIFRNTGIQEG